MTMLLLLCSLSCSNARSSRNAAADLAIDSN